MVSNKLSVSDFQIDEDLLILNKLNPAETYLLLNRKPKLIDLIKVTVLDLMLKQVIVVKEETFEIIRDVERDYVIVETAKNFSNYEAKNFENYFLQNLNEDVFFHMKNYIKNIHDTIPKNKVFYNEIKASSDIRHLFSDSILPSFLRGSHLKEQGVKLSEKINEFFKDLNNNLDHLINVDKEKGLELLLFLRGNIFLLENLDYKIFENLKLGASIPTSSYSWINHTDDFMFDVFHDTDFNDMSFHFQNSEHYFEDNSYFDDYSYPSYDSSYDFDFD